MAATARGIDVSSYQGKQDWVALAKGGLSFVQVKATEGLRKDDSRYRVHMDGVRKVPSLLPGAYHYAWPNQDATNEADHYINVVHADADEVVSFHHWLDLERREDGENYAGVNAAQIRAYAEAWIAHVKAAFPNQRVGVYTSGSDISSGHYPRNADALWYPAYPVGPLTYTQAEQRAKPNPGRPVLMWQFASKTRDGRSLDQSIAYLTPAALRAWAGAIATVREDDMQLTDKVTIPAGPWNPKPFTATVGELLGYNNLKADAAVAEVRALAKQVTAQSAAITALAKQLGTGKDVQTIVAAVEAAIATATVHVDVDVIGATADAPATPAKS